MLHRALLAAGLLWAGVVSSQAVTPVHAGDWPQWRGPNGDGVAQERNLPVAWSDNSAVAWKTPLPEWGASTPAIWGEAIFLTSHDGDKLLALKLNKTTGEIEWTRQIGTGTAKREGAKREEKFHKLHNLASPSPITDGKVVVFHFGNGDLAAFDFAGEKLWQRNLATDYGAYTVWWGHANTPVLHENLVISVCMQDSLEGERQQLSQSYLVAHDKQTGREVWKTSRMTGADAEQCDSYTTPIFVQVDRRLEMLVMGGNQLDAYDPASGKQLWFVPGLTGGRTITGPVAGHGLAFVTAGMRGPIHGIYLSGDGKLDDGKRLTDGKRDKTDAVAWKEDQSTPDSSCPVLWQDLLFLVTDNGIATCFDARSGQRHWRERLKGDYKASPVAAEGRLYLLNTQGLCTVLAARPRFDKLTENQISDETLASPALSNGRIYIRGKKALYAIEKK